MAERVFNLNRGYPAKAATRDSIELGCTAAFGASGAVTVPFGDPGLDVTLDSTGTYILHFPPLSTEQIKRTQVFLQAVSPALTFVSVAITDVSALTSGTLTVKLVKADGTAVEPASGDALMVLLKTTSSGVRQ